MGTFLEYQTWTTQNLLADSTDMTNNPLYTLANIKSSINRAQLEWVARLGQFNDFFRATPVTTNATAADITLDSGFFCNLQVLFGTSGNRKPLYQTSKSLRFERDANWIDETGTAPTGYSLNTTSSGTFTITLVPTLTATVTNGLTYYFTKKPTDMSADADTSKPMIFFPHLDMLAYPAYACVVMYGFAGGTKDDQQAKWMNVWEKCVSDAKAHLNRLAFSAPTYRR